MLDTLDPLSGDRKCFRLINGVLVERTVKDVVPALKTNQEGLKKVLDDLVKQYKSKQDELDKWKVRIPPFSPSYDDTKLRPSSDQVIFTITEEEQCAGGSAIMTAYAYNEIIKVFCYSHSQLESHIRAMPWVMTQTMLVSPPFSMWLP